jgi:DNA-directed RNA polymerase subunit RPC12/RpoP
MTSWIDKKYINLISSRLDKFKWTADDVANFRCPYCGDSSKKTSRHGYLYEMEGTYSYKCHKCSKSTSFKKFIKDTDQLLYREYILEKFQTDKKNQYTKKPVKTFKDVETLDGTVAVSSLPLNHEARKYLIGRKIPEKFFDSLYYTDNYKLWVNTYIIPNKFEHTDKPDARIIIPFMTAQNKPFAFQGRSLDPNCAERYITIKANDRLLVYGLERIDVKRTIKLCEGPIDSLFVDNCLAAAGSSLEKMVNKPFDIVFIFDNEPRSESILKLMQNVIDKNKKIVIWPKNISEKDINDMVKNGIDVNRIIRDNTYKGLKAKLKFIEWKKNA